MNLTTSLATLTILRSSKSCVDSVTYDPLAQLSGIAPLWTTNCFLCRFQRQFLCPIKSELVPTLSVNQQAPRTRIGSLSFSEVIRVSLMVMPPCFHCACRIKYVWSALLCFYLICKIAHLKQSLPLLASRPQGGSRKRCFLLTINRRSHRYEFQKQKLQLISNRLDLLLLLLAIHLSISSSIL